MMKGYVVVLIIVGLFVFGCFAGMNTAEKNGPGVQNVTHSSTPKGYTTHAPIRVNNDTDFTAQFSNRTIWNLDVNGTGYGCCIYIGNCSLPFTVTDCYLHNASGQDYVDYYYNTGLFLYQSSNGTILNNNCSENLGLYEGIGMYLSYSNNNTVTNNNCTGDSYYCMYVSYSNTNTITGNIFNGTSMAMCDFYLEFSNFNTVKDNGCTQATMVDIEMDYSNINTITNNICGVGPEFGVYLYYSDTNTFKQNKMYGCGIYITGGQITDFDTQTIDTTNLVNGDPVYYLFNQTVGSIPPGVGQVILANCSHIVVEGQYLSNCSIGIQMAYSDNCTISGNNCSYTVCSIIMLYSDTNVISDDFCFKDGYGVYLSYSSFNTIDNDYCNETSTCGFYMELSNNNVITDNHCTGMSYAMYLYYSNTNTFTGNICSGSAAFGFYMYASEANMLKQNEFYNYGIFLDGSEILDYNTQNIDATNLVNGNPVYYLANQTAKTIPAGVGQVILANCSHIAVEEQTLTNCSVSIEEVYSNNCSMSGNNCSNNYFGIFIVSSDTNTISDNVCSGDDYGMYLYYSNASKIAGNNCSNDYYFGMSVWYSNHDTLTDNAFIANWYYGLDMEYSNYNCIYHNIFIGNNGATSTYNPSNVQADDVSGTNFWNSSYPSGGNYWSDWTSPDTKSGPNQNQTGPDGIVDAPYAIDGGTGAQDFYPLTAQVVVPEASPLALILILSALIPIVVVARRRNR